MRAGERAAVTIQGLRKAYGSLVAVQDVSFEVATGEIFGVRGPNGSGKTTTVECIQGLRRADSGRIRVLGLDPQTHRQQLRRRIGSQLQESALLDRIKVWEARRLFASLAPGAADWPALIARWGWRPRATPPSPACPAASASARFVALALVNQPEVVFLDEMTTGLDPAARRETWGLIEAIRDQGTTVVLVTHFMDEAERLCDRLAVIKGGRVVALDTPGKARHLPGRRHPRLVQRRRQGPLVAGAGLTRAPGAAPRAAGRGRGRRRGGGTRRPCPGGIWPGAG